VRDEPNGYLRSFRSQSITARGSGSSGLRGGGRGPEGLQRLRLQIFVRT
jgi:hypothetical protein